MIEWIRIAAALLLGLAMILRRTEKRVVSTLRSSGATSEASAVRLPAVNRFGRWQLARLQAAGAVVAVGEERHYFVATGYERFRRARRRRAVIVVPVVVVLVLLLRYLSM